MHIPEEIIQKVTDTARIEDLFDKSRKSGKNRKADCPFCDKKITINIAGNYCKCFHCGEGGKPVNFISKRDKLSYIDAVKFLAERYQIEIEEDTQRAARLNHEKQLNESRKKTFLQKQLESSGLTPGDIACNIINGKGEQQSVSPFVVGIRNQYHVLKPNDGDDILIYYYDLEGRQVKYIHPKTKREMNFIRIRWKNPAQHIGKDGRPMKYQSPGGSGVHFYIPQKLKEAYQKGIEIETLFLDEGEKKAEKSCKHGMYSLGLGGIQGIGSKKQMPPELGMIIERCNVKNVYFRLDADCFDLSKDIKNGDDVDSRPKSFFYAVRNYKEYLRTLVNEGISVEIYFGHLKTKEKGVDDLLAGSLKGQEDSLLDDINYSINAKDGAGTFVHTYKITQLPDNRIADIFNLNDAFEFFKFHKEELVKLKEFKIRKVLRFYNEEKDCLENAQALTGKEQFWKEEYDSKGNFKGYRWKYVEFRNFLENQGFCKVESAVKKAGDDGGTIYRIIKKEGKIIRDVSHVEIREYVSLFLEENKLMDVVEMLLKGGKQYVGPDQVSNLHTQQIEMVRREPDKQRFYYQNGFVEITAKGIELKPYTALESYVESSVIKTGNIRISEEFFFDLNDEGDFTMNHQTMKECDFMQYLYNTCIFKGEENNCDLQKLHFASKLTAIGYLLHDYRNASEEKAVIFMDGKESIVGESCGRSGKTLVGNAIAQLVEQIFINGKNQKDVESQWRYEKATENTHNIFYDDLRVNFDFEALFAEITGGLKAELKGGRILNLPREKSPKFLFTTNHAINGWSDSYLDRQHINVFSDYYNKDHKPVDDFGRLFWSDAWEEKDWTMFYTFMFYCVKLYLKVKETKLVGKERGLIPAPDFNVERRKLRQDIGESFLSYMEDILEYEKPFEKVHQYNDFVFQYPEQKRYCKNVNEFKKKIMSYCKYKGVHLNTSHPNKNGASFEEWEAVTKEPFIGGRDKRNKKEYFTFSVM